jgi:xanthine/uracil/vitamin C permease (AzgA family)
MVVYFTSMFAQRPLDRASVRIEVLAGVTTFLTMAYIIMVQPAVLSGTFGVETGMDFGAVITATCLSAALATLLQTPAATSSAPAP